MDSTGLQRQIGSNKLGKYELYGSIDGKRAYKLAGNEFYLYVSPNNNWVVCLINEMYRVVLNVLDSFIFIKIIFVTATK